MTAGAAMVMWFGEVITERGVGNGMSLLIFAGIASRIPSEGKAILDSVVRWSSPSSASQRC